MRLIAEILLIIALPLTALLLRGQSTLLVVAVMGCLGIALVVVLSVTHHAENGKLHVGKFSEYAILALLAVVSYLLLV
jgi:hypothetical protein